MTQRGSVLLALSAVVLLGAGILVGVLINQDSGGGPLEASRIGNATHGRELFVSKGCAMCHSYEGRGGTDAPSLDTMRGTMSPADVANMSGTIWNHVPAMKTAFAEEGIPFPTFASDEMADLIAYLHGGGPPPNVSEGEGGGSMGSETQARQPPVAPGKDLFASTCGGCHSLAAAETMGTTGPNLDDLKPDLAAVLAAIKNGPGAMPSNLLTGAQAQQVAAFVAASAGR